jgi:Uma2 family endonuclease
MVMHQSPGPPSVAHAHLPFSYGDEHHMAMPALAHEWSVDLLDSLPENGQRYELIDGDLYVTPAPSEVHQLVALCLGSRLRQYLRPTDIARAVISPSDIRKPHRTLNRVQPDIFAVRLTNGQRPRYPYDLRDILLAVEILSPASRYLDRVVKHSLYLDNGVSEYWIVDTDAPSITAFTSEDRKGEVHREAISWHPAGATSPLLINIAELLEDALG